MNDTEAPRKVRVQREWRAKPVTLTFIEDNCIPEPNSGCWLWTAGLTGAGYGAFERDKKMYLAHRVSFQLFHDTEIPKGLFIRHSCDVRACVNPGHLLPGTQADNVHDAVLRNRVSHGSGIWTAKLKKEQIPEIRALLMERKTCVEIAWGFGVDPSLVSLIKHNKIWRRA